MFKYPVVTDRPATALHRKPPLSPWRRRAKSLSLGMTSKRAIASLIEQKDKLANKNNRNDAWISITKSLIKDYFGAESEQFKYIRGFDFSDLLFADKWDEENQIKKNTIEVSQFLDGCIELLKTRPLYKEPKTNFLMRLDNSSLVTLLLGVLAIIGPICFAWGKYSSDLQNIELKQQVKEHQATINKLQQQLKAKLPPPK
jgi:hypothetical protein